MNHFVKEVQQEEANPNPPPAMPIGQTPKPCALYTLLVLTFLNMMNYCDRFIPSTTKEVMKSEWNLTDAETGFASLVFLLVYMLASPLFGTLADAGISRKLLLLLGILIWSAASSSAYWTTNLQSFLVSRAFVGLGEASFSVIAPTFLSDFYPPSQINKALTVFYLSMPLGAAIGFGLGGILTEHFSWQTAYLTTGVPGIIIAGLLLPVVDPGLGSYESDKNSSRISWWKTLKLFSTKKMYIIVVIASTFQSFGVGAAADWMPAFYQRFFPEVSVTTSSLVLGGATFFGGLCGITLGGFSAEYFAGKTIHPKVAVGCLGAYGAVICVSVAIFAQQYYITSTFVFLTQIFLFVTTAPLTAQISHLMPANIRARALGFQLLISHSFGDAISPTILGAVSDASSNFLLAQSLIPLSLCFGAIIFLIGWRCLPPSETFIHGDEETDLLLSMRTNDHRTTY